MSKIVFKTVNSEGNLKKEINTLFEIFSRSISWQLLFSARRISLIYGYSQANPRDRTEVLDYVFKLFN